MKPIRFPIFLLACLPALFGQKSPKENAMVWLGVHCSIYAAYDYGIAMSSSQPGEDMPFNTPYTNGQGLSVLADSGNILAHIYPGRLYTIYVSSANWTTADVHFNPPPGYTVYIGPLNMGRTPANSFLANSTTMGPTYSLNIELRPNDGANLLPAGYATAPALSDITWAVSLGTLRENVSAGTLRWRFNYLSSDILNAFNLVFADPVSSEVHVELYPDYAIKYVWTPKCQLRVLRNSDPVTGYALNFYLRGDDPGEARDFPGITPYASYIISTPGNENYNNRVQIVRTQEGITETWLLAAVGSTTTLTQSNSNRVLTTASTPDSPVAGQRTEVITLSELNGAPATKTIRIYQNFVWNSELIREIADPDGAALTTTYDYYTENWEWSGSGRKLKSITRPDGSWEKYDYFAEMVRWGQLQRIYKPWQTGTISVSGVTTNVTPANASLTNCQVTTLNYLGERSVYEDILAGSETVVLGTAVGRSTTTATFDSLSAYNIWLYKAPMRTETTTAFTGANSSLVTTRKVFYTGTVPGPSGPTSGSVANPALAGKLYFQINPDGTKTSASYVQGSFLGYLRIGHAWMSSYFSPGTDSFWCETYLSGTAAQTAAESELVSTDGMTGGRAVDPVWMIPYKSTRRQLVRDYFGNPNYELTYVYTGSGAYALIGWTEFNFGTDGLIYRRKSADATTWIGSRIRGQLNYETNPDGTRIQYFFDTAMRVQTKEMKPAVTTPNFPAQASIYTTYAYDAADHILSETTAAGGLALVKTRTYNLDGSIKSETDERGLLTNYIYSNNARTVTKTMSGGSTLTADRYLDGSPQSITGSGAVSQFTNRTIVTLGTESGYISTTTYVATNGGPRWVKSYVDWLGRPVREEKPTWHFEQLRFVKMSLI